MPFAGARLRSAIRGTKRKAERVEGAKRRLKMSKEIVKARIARAEAEAASLGKKLREMHKRLADLEKELISAKEALKKSKGGPEKEILRISKEVELWAREISFTKSQIKKNTKKHAELLRSISEAQKLI
ncbi:MAG: hypothetical protein N3F05_04285 [Candidatus Diapherotrites archaeon]|nr:hypothetical protein [Candidatus Diapherotrites archaeon]